MAECQRSLQVGPGPTPLLAAQITGRRGGTGLAHLVAQARQRETATGVQDLVGSRHALANGTVAT